MKIRKRLLVLAAAVGLVVPGAALAAAPAGANNGPGEIPTCNYTELAVGDQGAAWTIVNVSGPSGQCTNIRTLTYCSGGNSGWSSPSRSAPTGSFSSPTCVGGWYAYNLVIRVNGVDWCKVRYWNGAQAASSGTRCGAPV